jgi:hypothetical protein
MPLLLFDEKMGTRAVKSVPLTAFPWAINGIGQVIYIDCKDDLLAARTPVPSPLLPYSKPISMDRRRKCQSLLAHLALTQRSYTSGAVTKVSLGVLDYILQCLKTNKSIRKEIEFCMDRYMYSKAGFGRLGQPEDKPKGDGELYRRCLTALTQGELPTILAIHDFMGRVVFKNLGGSVGQKAVFDQTGNAVRPAYVFGGPKDPSTKIEELRGRTARPGNPPPSTAPGLLSEEEVQGKGIKPYQERERGSDKWMPTTEKVPQSTIDIQQRNLIFGAGPSGSTGTLLQAGKLFGNLDGELLQQYVLAIVAYLVGGGMHSYHEVMVIARMAGCPYKDGAYVPSLPENFLRSADYKEWQADFFDIVVLGGKLWFLDDAKPKLGRLHSERVTEFEKQFAVMPKKTGQLDPGRVSRVGEMVAKYWKK